MVDEAGNIVHKGRIYFLACELKCKRSGKLLLASNFADRLLSLRLEYAQPMYITSACRSEAHNGAVGGAEDSMHICDSGRGCCAVDVGGLNGLQKAQLIKQALITGWTVGVAKHFIHLDRRTDYYPHRQQLVYSY